MSSKAFPAPLRAKARVWRWAWSAWRRQGHSNQAREASRQAWGPRAAKMWKSPSHAGSAASAAAGTAQADTKTEQADTEKAGAAAENATQYIVEVAKDRALLCKLCRKGSANQLWHTAIQDESSVGKAKVCVWLVADVLQFCG